MSPNIIHAISPCTGPSELFNRQKLFLQGVDDADKKNVLLLALDFSDWERPGWKVKKGSRSSLSIGDSRPRPFLIDLLNLANNHAEPNDWLLYTNIDCVIAPDLYAQLQNERGTVVEYVGKDIEGTSSTTAKSSSNKDKLFSPELGGLAVRAQFLREIKDYFPDLIAGEPYWDTISELFRKIIPVKRDTRGLFYSKHRKLPDLGNLSVSGKHNYRLYKAALNFSCDESTCIANSPNQTDTAVVAVSFGNDPIRIAANSEGIRKQLQQDLYYDYFLVELIEKEKESAYPTDILKAVEHIRIEGGPDSMDLFQKEALMNIGWRTALTHHSYEYFIFADGDIYSNSPNWFRRIREKLWENPARAVHGYRIVSDSKDTNLKYNSLASAFRYNFQTDLPLNPGLCWGLHRSILEMGNGINSLLLDCAGDSTFVVEYLNSKEFPYESCLYQFRWFSEIERKLPFQAILDGVNIDTIHIHHGDLKERNYVTVRYAIEGFPPIADLVKLEANGTLSWRNPECVERRILSHRSQMKTHDDVDKIFQKYSYTRFNGNPNYPKKCTKERRLFKANNSKKISPFSNRSSTADKKKFNHRIIIFNLAKVFRNEFLFSWSYGIHCNPESSYIPIKDNPPSLVLESKNATEEARGGLFIRPNWIICDLTLYKHLFLSVLLTGNTTQDIKVSFISKSEENQDYLSTEISLEKLGLVTSQLTQFKIPLEDFYNDSGFDLRNCCFISIAGVGKFKIELQNIYLE